MLNANYQTIQSPKTVIAKNTVMLLSTIGPPQGYEPVFACTDNVSQGVSWCSGECRWDQSSERDRYGCHEGKIGVNVLLNRFTVNSQLQSSIRLNLGTSENVFI